MRSNTNAFEHLIPSSLQLLFNWLKFHNGQNLKYILIYREKQYKQRKMKRVRNKTRRKEFLQNNKLKENRLRWLDQVNRGEEKNAAIAMQVIAMTLDGKCQRRIPKNTWERTKKKDVEKLSLREELCGYRKQWRLRISKSESAQCGLEDDNND